MGSTETLVSLPITPRRSIATPVLMLTLCCFLWGFSFPAAQQAAIIVEKTVGDPPLSDLALRTSFSGWRNLIAALAYLLLTFPRQRGFTAHDIRSGCIIGTVSAAGVLLQLIGLRYTVPSTSAFLTALAVVFAPLAQMLLFRRAVSGRVWLSIALALGGMVLLSYPSSSSATGQFVQTPPFPLAGEIFTTIGALLFTGQILAIDRYGKTADVVRLTLVTLAAGAVVSLGTGLLSGAGVGLQLELVPKLATDMAFMWRFGVMALLATAISMHLMTRYQPLLTPAIATVVYCLEPVFGTAFSLVMGNESLSMYTLFGGSVILVAVVLVARE